MAQPHLRPVARGGKSTNLITIDGDTGERVEGIAVLVQPKRRWITEGYSLVISQAITASAMDRDLGAQDLRVLNYMIGTIGFENGWENLNQAAMAEVLGMKRPHVNRAIKKLVAKGIIIQGVRINRGHIYSMNPNFAWKGPAAKWPAASKKAPSLKLVQGGGGNPIERSPDSASDLGCKSERSIPLPLHDSDTSPGVPTLT